MTVKMINQFITSITSITSIRHKFTAYKANRLTNQQLWDTVSAGKPNSRTILSSLSEARYLNYLNYEFTRRRLVPNRARGI